MPLEIFSTRIETECEKCSDKCCSQPYDWVYLTEQEAGELATQSATDKSSFAQKKVNHFGTATFLTLELPCRFLDSATGKCTIYHIRPLICRLYPYYAEPATGTVGMLPGQCGANLKLYTADSDRGWSVDDRKESIVEWLDTIWKEARARYSESCESNSPTSDL